MKPWRNRTEPAGLAGSYSSTARTHVGTVRLVNEDRFFDAPDKNLWVVADGMGGHSAGDIAATMAVRAFAALTGGPRDLSIHLLAGALRTANADIARLLDEQGRTGGSTIAGLWIERRTAHIFWMGDSRVYRLRAGKLERLTHDHSLVQELVDSGALPSQLAAGHPHANIVTRALGVSEATEPEFRRYDIESGDKFFICSDGVTNELSDCEISACIGVDQAASADGLAQRIETAGARDNFTFVIVAKRQPIDGAKKPL